MRSPYIYELVFKIGSICSDFRNEDFKNFQVFFLPDLPRFRSAKLGPPQNILPSYGTVMYVKAFDDDTIPDTETLKLLTYLPDRVHCHWPTMTADPAKLNQYFPTASEK